jgi:hypothetical protein
MTDSNNEVTISTLQADNAALKLELDSLKTKIAQKDAQDRDDLAAAAAKAQEQSRSSARPPVYRNKLIETQKPSSVYTPVPPEEITQLRRLFGPGSDSRLANQLGLQSPQEYARQRQRAVNAGLIS